MGKLKLSDVTLVMVETREHELAAMAVDDCCAKAEFGAILILTNDPTKFWINGKTELEWRNQARFFNVPDWPDKLGWSRAWWFTVPPLLHTRQTLNIQWDSWIADAAMWDDSFLQYDYIGAPWWYKDGKNVGNGGFSLVSTVLKRYIYGRRDKFPCDTSLDDDLLCRKYRPQLEDAGFVWAPESVAHKFSFECCRKDKAPAFGFHAAMNFPDVLDRDRLIERVRLMCASPYIGRSYMMKAMYEKRPALITEILNEIDEPERSAA